tara:strand:- start:174 stop:695 length:522 start_codon:yes stop_codon:yes gene_type:complete
MSGSLIKIQEVTVSSAVSSVTVTGIDSTYDVYKLIGSNFQCADDDKNLIIHFTATGTGDTTANYDSAFKQLVSGSGFTNSAGANSDALTIAPSLSNATNETSNIVLHLFNFSNASHYSYATLEANTILNNSEMRGLQGSIVLTVTAANDGVKFTWESNSNFSSGTFTLYGLKK